MADLNPVKFLDKSTPPHIMTLVLLSGLSALTMNIFLPSLPSMAAWFDVPYALIQLSVAFYLGLSAVLQILIGPISDRFGRRRVILGAMGLFLLATIGTLLATNVTQFLIFRMAQAVIAAGMVLSRAVVRDMVPGAEAASMIGWVTMGMSIVPMIGPMIGGVLDDTFGWQANFVLLLVLGIVVFFLVWRDLGETATIRRIGLKEQARQYPALLASRRFWGYCLCAAFGSGSFFAYLGGAPFVGTNVFLLSASEVGIYFAAPAVGYALGNFLSGKYSVRVGMNNMVLYGVTISTARAGFSWSADLAGPAFCEFFLWHDHHCGSGQRHDPAQCQCGHAVDQARACGNRLGSGRGYYHWRRRPACRPCRLGSGAGIVRDAADHSDDCIVPCVSRRDHGGDQAGAIIGHQRLTSRLCKADIGALQRGCRDGHSEALRGGQTA